MIALCVSGSRKWKDAGAILTRLVELEPQLAVVIEGGAPGADRIAGKWASRARKRGVAWVRFPADWDRYGKKAGPVRNAQMVTYLLQAAELGWEPRLLAFPLGASPGTRNMIEQCKAAGVHGVVVRPCRVVE